MPPEGNNGPDHLSGSHGGASGTATKTKDSNKKGEKTKGGAMSAKLQGASLSFARKHPKLTKAGKVVGFGIAGYAAVGAVNTTVRVIRGSSLKSAAKAGFGLGALEIE